MCCSTAQYFGATIVLLAISTALTVVVLNIHHRGSLGKPVPSMVQLVVLDWLARMLGFGKHTDKHKLQNNTVEMVRISGELISKTSKSFHQRLNYLLPCLFSLATKRTARVCIAVVFTKASHRRLVFCYTTANNKSSVNFFHVLGSITSKRGARNRNHLWIWFHQYIRNLLQYLTSWIIVRQSN